MQNFKTIIFITVTLIISFTQSYSQHLNITDDYLILNAYATDPLYTTYTAAMERSRMYGDKGYKMDYYNDNAPLNYTSDQAGRFYNVWMINKLVIDNIGKYFKKPIVKASFPDMAILEYEPFEGLKVQECFFVYSSTISLCDITIKNTTDITHAIDVFPILELGNDSLLIIDYDDSFNGYILNHYESPKRLISNLHTKFGYPTQARDFFTVSFNPYSYGGYKGDLDVFYNYIKTDFYDENRKNDSLNFQKSGYTDFVAFQYKFNLKPGETKNFRYFRGWQAQEKNQVDLIKKIEKLKNESLQKYVDKDVKLFKLAPHINFETKDEKLVYIGALNLARTCMLPPSGKTNYNFYVFSRQPLWGWGHGHQVLHESLSMMAYVYLDPESAQNSQRIYMEQQGDDGLIAYRHGPRGPQTYPHKGKPTTSAPFYSWINWEVYKVSKDEKFLKDAYESGEKYLNWLIKNRDVDKDGTFEWGPYGIIENVRDWYNAVFQVSADRYLDVDKEDISDELECLDLTLMVVKEMRCLAKIAEELGKKKEAKKWTKNADKISELVNELMWDEHSEFYYSINKKDHSFFFMDRDLKRQEIIGFLALWAEAAPKDRAEKLIKTLTDTTKFWRKYGVPTLAADDEWYSPYVDYCCKWNGPVWLLWDYMVFDGLVNYGYYDLAKQLADKMMLAVTTQLSKNHNFWESFSPDNEVLNCPSNYIWDSIMAKLLIEVDLLKSSGKIN